MRMCKVELTAASGYMKGTREHYSSKMQQRQQQQSPCGPVGRFATLTTAAAALMLPWAWRTMCNKHIMSASLSKPFHHPTLPTPTIDQSEAWEDELSPASCYPLHSLRVTLSTKEKQRKKQPTSRPSAEKQSHYREAKTCNVLKKHKKIP